MKPGRGDVVGSKYRVLERLGGGHTADVFAAASTEDGARVALKVLTIPETAPRSAEAASRFLAEARAMSALKSEHATRVLDVGTTDSGAPFIAMELLEGVDLEALATGGEMSVERAVDLVLQACAAVAEAHALGMVHRDIKPSNLFVTKRSDGSDLVKVLDFGISKVPTEWTGDVGLTSTQAMMGTPLYMSPEQFEDASKVDARSDVWSLGAVLYRLLTGRPPWQAGSAFALHTKILREDPIPPAELRGDVGDRLSDVILRCLQRDPAARFDSATALADALAAAPRHASTARPPSRRWIVGLAGVAALGVTLAAAARIGSAPRPTVLPSSPPLKFEPTNARRVTFGAGCDEFPAFTKDGRSVVYDSTNGPASSIMTIAVAGGEPRTITTVAGWDYAARPSPDGQSVAFLRAAEGKTTLYVAGMDGAPSTLRAIAEGNGRPSWSRDGAFLWGGDRAHVIRYDRASAKAVESIAVPAGYRAVRAFELPNGELAVLFPSFEGAAGGGIGIYDEKRAFRWLVQGPFGVELSMTADGEHFLATREFKTGSGNELVDVPLRGAARSLADKGIVLDAGHDVSPDGRAVVWSDCRGVDHAAAVADEGALSPLPISNEGEEKDVAAVAGTNKVVVLSSRAGPTQPWVVDLAGGASMPLASGAAVPTSVSVSPDGKWLAFASTEGLRVLAYPEGEARAEARSLSNSAVDSAPSFRRGSTEVTFTREGEDGQSSIWVVPVTGGAAHPLVPAPSRRAAPSPTDDRVLYLDGPDPQRLTPMLFDPSSSTRKPLSPALAPARYGPLAFSASGRKAAVLRASREIVEVDASTGRLLRTVHSDDQLTRIAYAGERLLVVRRQWRGHLWLADLSP